MCWYPLVPQVPRSLCQWVSLHPSTLLVPHVESLVPLTLCVGTPRYPWYPWYQALCANESLCTPVLCWYHMLSLWYHSLYVLVPLGTLGTPGTKLSVPVSLSAPQYSAGTTCWVFGTTDSMCWYPSVALVPLVPSSLCQWVSLHPSTLLVPHVEFLVPLTLCVGTPRYSWYPWYQALCASESLCTPALFWYHMLSLWYHSLYVLVLLGTRGTALCLPVSLSAP